MSNKLICPWSKITTLMFNEIFSLNSVSNFLQWIKCRGSGMLLLICIPGHKFPLNWMASVGIQVTISFSHSEHGYLIKAFAQTPYSKKHWYTLHKWHEYMNYVYFMFRIYSLKIHLYSMLYCCFLGLLHIYLFVCLVWRHWHVMNYRFLTKNKASE